LKDQKKYIFVVLLLILAYFCYIMIAPFITYMLLGLVLVIALDPLYESILKRVKHKKLSSWLSIIIILLIVIIPSILIGGALIRETAQVFSNVDVAWVKNITSQTANLLGIDASIDGHLNQLITNVGDFMLKSGLSMVSSVVDAIIGLFIMFSIIYYGFTEGGKWMERLEAFIPFNDERREHLVMKIKKVTKAVIYGEIFIAIIQGVLGGLCFYIVGIPNPIFWGFVMAILAFLPFVGTGCIWVPAAIMQLMGNNIGNAIFIIVYGVLVITGIDYVLRPEIISAGSEVHPLIALIGAFGGLKIFGFIGLILGPLLAALFATIISFYYEDYLKKKSLPAKRTKKTKANA
jgi:predicted PurR-regulated permease PerM